MPGRSSGAATLGGGGLGAPARLNAALAGAAVSLCTGPLQGWIEGRITPRDQLQGTFARARLRDLRPIHAGDITVARLAYLLRFFRKGDGDRLTRRDPHLRRPSCGGWARRPARACARSGLDACSSTAPMRGSRYGARFGWNADFIAWRDGLRPHVRTACRYRRSRFLSGRSECRCHRRDGRREPLGARGDRQRVTGRFCRPSTPTGPDAPAAPATGRCV